MSEQTESSAIIRFIHRQEQPIVSAEHAIETQIVRNPLLLRARSRRKHRFAVGAVIAVIVGLVAWFLVARFDRQGRVIAAPAPAAKPSVTSVVPPPTPAAPPPDTQPLVMSISEEEQTGVEMAPHAELEEIDGEIIELDDLQDAEPVAEEPVAEEPVAEEQSPPAVSTRTPKLRRRVGPVAAAPARRRAAGRRSRVAPSPNQGLQKGVLMIATKPPCRISINDRDTGLTTPQREIKLSGGRHKVTLTNREHSIRSSLSVNIKPGKSVRVVRDLTDRMRPGATDAP